MIGLGSDNENERDRKTTVRQKESFPSIIQCSLLKEKNYHGAGRMIVARSHAAIPGDHKYQINIFVCSPFLSNYIDIDW